MTIGQLDAKSNEAGRTTSEPLFHSHATLGCPKGGKCCEEYEQMHKACGGFQIIKSILLAECAKPEAHGQIGPETIRQVFEGLNKDRGSS